MNVSFVYFCTLFTVPLYVLGTGSRILQYSGWWVLAGIPTASASVPCTDGNGQYIVGFSVYDGLAVLLLILVSSPDLKSEIPTDISSYLHSSVHSVLEGRKLRGVRWPRGRTFRSKWVTILLAYVK